VSAVESVIFKKDVRAGETMTPLKARVKGEATLERLVVRFYSGQVGCLQIRPMLKRLNGSFIDLVSYVGFDKYLSGDDDVLRLPVNMPVYNDEEITIFAKNTAEEEEGEEGLKTYTVNVIAEIDYYSGTRRVVGGVLNG